MCSGSKSKLSPLDMVMEGKSPNQEDQISSKGSVLLELSASDDLNGFRCEVEEKGFDVDTLGLWYGRRIGSKWGSRRELLFQSLPCSEASRC